MRATDVDPEDLQALLAELSTVGGHIDQEQNLLTARPATRRVGRGVVAGMSSVPTGSFSHGSAPTPSSAVGGGGGGAALASGPSSTEGLSLPPSTQGGSTWSVPPPPRSTGFSSYSTVGLGEAEQSHRAYITPLNVRLAPLGSSASDRAGKTVSPVPPPPRGAAPSSRAAERPRVATNPPSSVAPLSPPLGGILPLPALSGGAVSKGPGVIPSVESFVGAGPLGDRKPLRGPPESSAADPRLPSPFASSSAASSALPPTSGGRSRIPPATTTPGVFVGEAEEEEEDRLTYRESNFLPIMCARYLHPVGITPPPSWGHTLTPLAAAGSQLLLFGGMQIRTDEALFAPLRSSNEHVAGPPSRARPSEYDPSSASSHGSSVVMLFHTNEIAWEPLAVFSGEPPAPRHSHAACGYDGHCLVVFGGQSVTDSGRLFGDVHLFNVHEHSWKCLWEFSATATAGKKNIPTPRYGHSMVLRHNRLYIYGGRVHRSTNNSRNENTTKETSRGKSSSSSSSLTSSGSANLSWASSQEVYVFSLDSRKWKRRLRIEKRAPADGENTKRGSGTTGGSSTTPLADEDCPPPRAFHAACIKEPYMYINGGEGPEGAVYNDTWCVDLSAASNRGAEGNRSSAAQKIKSTDRNKEKSKEEGMQWKCLHAGQSVDAISRSRHHLFVAGEALLAVGGCGTNGGANGPVFSDRLTGKFLNFAAVLPIPFFSFVKPSSALLPSVTGEQGGGAGGQASSSSFRPLWMPVAMGNSSIVTPSKRSFAAALCGGFVYLFGGQSGSEPATNGMIRFLAADGYTTSDLRGSASGNDEALRNVLLSLRVKEKPFSGGGGGGTGPGMEEDGGVAPSLPYDTYAMAGTYGAVVAGHHDRSLLVGLHRSIVRARAPKFWEDLIACRSDPLSLPRTAVPTRTPPSMPKDGVDETAPRGKDSGAGDALDAWMHHSALPSSPPTQDPSHAPLSSSAAVIRERGEGGKTQGESNARGLSTLKVYYTVGTSRVAGLPIAVGMEELRALVYYLYCADLPTWFSPLLEEEEEEMNGEEGIPIRSEDGAAKAVGTVSGHLDTKERLRVSLHTLVQLATTYELPMLQQLSEAYQSGKRLAVERIRMASAVVLRADLLHLLETGNGATVTVLFADPHTKEQSSHVLHPAILMSASSFFADLLSPLYGGFKTQFQIGPVVAKVTIATHQASGREGGRADDHDYGNVEEASVHATELLTSTSKRSIIVGPISISKLAVLPILRFMYSQVLQVPKCLAYSTMLGANQLDLPLLRGYCESVVAREEVTYDSCCGFYHLSKKYQTSLLEEMSLLTAVSGYSTVRYTPGFKNLSPEDQQCIDDVVKELGSSSWSPPPAPTNELKTAETYAERWKSSAGVR